MRCEFVLFSFLAIGVLVDSFPFPDGNRGTTYQSGIRPNSRLHFQPGPNVNHPWQNNQHQGISPIPSTQSPVFVWNNHNYRDSGTLQLNDGRNFVRIPNDFGYGQQYKTYDSVTPVAPLENEYYSQWNKPILHQPSTAAPHNANRERWNNQRFQKDQFYALPYETNTFVPNYAQSNAYQRNYGNIKSHYQLPEITTPNTVNNFNNHGEGRFHPSRNFYIPTPSSVEYLPWPVPDNELNQSADNNIPNDNRPGPQVKQSQPLNLIQEQHNDRSDVTEAIQESLNNQSVVQKRYIIVHVNGTYEEVNNLDGIEVDELDIAHITSNEKPNHILAIFEVEDTNESETQESQQGSYKAEITNKAQDNLNIVKHEYPGMLQSYSYPYTSETTEATTYDMKYFKPEYIMPIQSTTENAINDTSNSLISHTTTKNDTNTINNNLKSTAGNIIVDTAVSNIYPTTKNGKDDISDQVCDSSTNGVTGSPTENTPSSSISSTADSIIDTATVDSTINSDVNPFNHMFKIFKSKLHNKNHEYMFTTQSTLQKEHKLGYSNDGDDMVFNEGINSNNDTTTWSVNYEGSENITPVNRPDTPDISEKKSSGNAIKHANFGAPDSFQGDSKLKKESASVLGSSVSESDNYSIEDNTFAVPVREIDVSELKTVVGEPVVWFRPDETFWDKITKGEQAFDAVSIYDVRCKPKLIERVTTIHHHANGTETVEYVETIWDSLDSPNPREIRSKREFREPKHQRAKLNLK